MPENIGGMNRAQKRKLDSDTIEDFDRIFERTIASVKGSHDEATDEDIVKILDSLRENLVQAGYDRVDNIWVSRQGSIDERRAAQAQRQATLLGFQGSKLVRIQERANNTLDMHETAEDNIAAHDGMNALRAILDISQEALPSSTSPSPD